MAQVTDSTPVNFRSTWFPRIGAVAALTTGILLLFAMISLFASVLQPGKIAGWQLLLQNNWLVLIFKLHAEFSSAHADILHGLNLLDIFILALVGTLCLSLSIAFRKAGKIWTFVAFALTLAAIVLYLATQLAGRSTVMLSVLIISIVMLSNKTFNRVTIYSGILASVLLFVGDLTVGIHSNTITVLFGVGYVFLVIWFFLIAGRLFRSGNIVK
jgi:hypothetical protein